MYLIDPTLDDDARRDAVMALVRATFKPEFLNRLDDVILFDPLGTDELTANRRSADRSPAATRLADRRLTLSVTPAALEWLAMTGFDPLYGARPLRRFVQSAIGDQARPRLAVRRDSRRRHGAGRRVGVQGRARSAPCLTVRPTLPPNPKIRRVQEFRGIQTRNPPNSFARGTSGVGRRGRGRVWDGGARRGATRGMTAAGQAPRERRSGTAGRLLRGCRRPLRPGRRTAALPQPAAPRPCASAETFSSLDVIECVQQAGR